MFETHPVPQQISSYQFRLVGDMTLKQFTQLGGGALISLLVYASPFPAFIKWPLVIFFAIAGAAIAFLPFEDRPLDQWVFAFFRSIYSPTIFTWQKAQKLNYFQEETVPATLTPAPSVPSMPSAAEQNLVSRNPFISNLEQTEKDFLTKFTSLFTISLPKAQTPAASTTAIAEVPARAPVAVPQAAPTTITPLANAQTQQILVPTSTQTTAVPQTFDPTGVAQTANAQFSPEAAPPIPPSQPNVIVGQVMDHTGKIVEGAILEIKDTLNRPVRALRSNKAGHFLIVTPLPNGQYQMVTEKEGFVFKPVTINVQGSVIPPIGIRAEEPKQ